MTIATQSWLEEKKHSTWSHRQHTHVLSIHKASYYAGALPVPPSVHQIPIELTMCQADKNCSWLPRPNNNILVTNFCSYHNSSFPHLACPENASLGKEQNLETKSSHHSQNRGDTAVLKHVCHFVDTFPTQRLWSLSPPLESWLALVTHCNRKWCS